MSAIDKLAARPTLQRSLVQQAMQEAKADPKAQQKLQQLVDQRAGDFEDAGLVDTVQQFLTGLFDVVVAGQKKPGGPFLPLTGLPKLPPHAVLEVVKDGAVVQALRADGDGVLAGMLRGVHVGDALSFRLRDAAGRLFPARVDGFVVPDGKVTSTVTTQTPPALLPLHALALGTGGLAAAGLDPLRLTPATIHVGKTAPTDFQQKHALTSQLGGAIIAAPDAAFMAAHAPDLSLVDGATLTVKHEPGRKVFTVDVKGQAGGPVSFGWDDTLQVFSPPLTEADVPRLQAGLAGAPPSSSPPMRKAWSPATSAPTAPSGSPRRSCSPSTTSPARARPRARPPARPPLRSLAPSPSCWS